MLAFSKNSRALAPNARTLVKFVFVLTLCVWAGMALMMPVAAQTVPVHHATQPVADTLGLSRFNANSTKDHKILLKWKTGSELSILGFNVWRRTPQGAYKKLNSEIIYATNPGQVLGANYKLPDRKVRVGKTYIYQLEVVSAFGYSTFTDEVSVLVR